MCIINKYKTFFIFLLSFVAFPGYANDDTSTIKNPELKIKHDSITLQQLNDNAWKLRLSDPSRAIYLTDSIIKIAKEKKDYKSLVTAYNNLGMLYSASGDYSKATDWVLKAYNIASDKNDNIGLGLSMNNLSIIYQNKKQYDKSIEYLNYAINVYLKNHKLSLIGNSYINLGTIYKEMGDFQKSLYYYRLSIKYTDSINDLSLKTNAKLNIAEIYVITKEYDKAMDELKGVRQVCRQTNDLANYCFYHQLMGDYYYANNQFDEARGAYNQAYWVALQRKDIKLRIESFQRLIKLYETIQDYKNAYKCQNERHTLIDSLNNIQNYLLMSRIELQDEFDQKMDDQNRQNEIKKQLQLSEITYQKRISIFLFVSLLLILGFGFIAYMNYRQKLKNAKILSSQREEILLKNEALRKQIEEDRQKSEIIEYIDKENEILSLVAKETENFVFILSPSGAIEWVNEAFNRISGFSLEEYKRTHGSKIQEASSSETIKEDFDNCVNYKIPVSYTSRSETKDKRTIWIHTTLTPVLNENNEVTRVIAIDSDITDIKQVKDEIDRKNQEITSSLEYASRIQNSLLPLKTELESIFSDYFIINLPQSIVSGDFYWTIKKNGQTLAVVGDSTGHGVPGAFMSLLGISSLQEIVYKMQDLNPAVILEKLRERIVFLLHYENSELSSSESWDIAVCVIDEKKSLKYAGSNNSVLILRDDVLIELKPDKFFIWDEITSKKAFTEQNLQLLPDDKVYLFTDGFSDQFGGQEDKKFSRRKLKKLLLDIHSLPMDSQKELLMMILKAWKGRNEQVDDIMVLGFQV